MYPSIVIIHNTYLVKAIKHDELYIRNLEKMEISTRLPLYKAQFHENA